jgi:hypothetical protein
MGSEPISTRLATTPPHNILNWLDLVAVPYIHKNDAEWRSEVFQSKLAGISS